MLTELALKLGNKMIDREKVLAAANAAPTKVLLEEHREAVQVLRDKGFTWREIADFLTEQGVQTDHTRVYRMFGQQPKRQTNSRAVEISRITYVGQRMTRKGGKWNLMEIELPSKLGKTIVVLGHAWGTGAAKLVLGEDDSVSFRDASLVTKSGSGLPMAYLKAEFQAEGDYWSQQEVHIVPKWDELL